LLAAPLLFAAVLWATSLPTVDLRAMTDLGLVSVLPPAYWAALVLVLTAFVVLLHTRRARDILLAGHLALLVLILHGTPALLYGSLRYGWAWKHVGIVEYVTRRGEVDPDIGGAFAAYHSWPGFFTLNGVLVEGSGLASALSYASWAPVVFQLALMGPLLLLFDTLTRDERQKWLAVLVFYLGNWVGQDYFAPQPFAYLMYVTVLAVCLRWLPAARDPDRLRRPRSWFRGDVPGRERGPGGRGFLVGVVVLLMVVIVGSHPLTPFMLLSALVLLVFGRQVGPAWLPWFLAGATVLWMLLMAQPFLGQNLYWIVESIARPDANALTTSGNFGQTSMEQRLVVLAGRALTAAVALLAVVGLVRLRRLGEPHVTAGLLVVSPVLLVILNAYGGEMPFRVYLFALPFLAVLAAGAVYPRPGASSASHAARRSRTGVGVPGLLALIVSFVMPFCLAYYGKERANYFKPEEVAASEWVYDHAPPGSLLVAGTTALPWAYTHYETYEYMFLSTLPLAEREVLERDPLGGLEASLGRRDSPIYVILSDSQDAEARYTGPLPDKAVATLGAALARSPSAREVFRSGEAKVFSVTLPIIGGRP
jgi:hypothetical protein